MPDIFWGPTSPLPCHHFVERDDVSIVPSTGTDDTGERSPIPPSLPPDPDGSPGCGPLLDDETSRLVPLFPDSKSSWVRGATWRGGLTSPQLTRFVEEVGDLSRDTFTDVPIEDLAWLQRPGAGSAFDLGYHLTSDRRVVVDADVVRVRHPGRPGEDPWESYEDGRQELVQLQRDLAYPLPPTLVLKTSGRPDGSHLPGRHYVFNQHPDLPVRARQGKVTPHCEALTAYIRVSRRVTVIRDLPIATLPLKWAAILNQFSSSQPRSVTAGDSPVDWAGMQSDAWMAGLNNALTKVKGMLMHHGLSEDAANDGVEYLNSLFDDPISGERLAGTVLKRKGWTSD